MHLAVLSLKKLSGCGGVTLLPAQFMMFALKYLKGVSDGRVINKLQCCPVLEKMGYCSLQKLLDRDARAPSNRDDFTAILAQSIDSCKLLNLG